MGVCDAGRVWLITGATSGFGREPTEAAVAAGDETFMKSFQSRETLLAYFCGM